MTKNKDFKTAARQHMAATGQSYTAARADLQANPAATSATGRIPSDAHIFVTGHGGLVGGALLRKLQALGYSNLLVATRDQLDLRDQAAVNYWFRANRPEYVFLVAGTVGGIGANSQRPADFLYDNMMIHATVVHASTTSEPPQPAAPRSPPDRPGQGSTALRRGCTGATREPHL